MSGMTKVGTGEKLEDSNLAAYGSKEHKDAKLAAAKTEKAWKGAGEKVGIQIWRIEQFKVKHVIKKTYGTFFRGDSYIILNSYKEPDNPKMLYNVHFWLGKETTQDEAGTAAYKTVELDDLLGDLPVQYREVEGCESDEFLKLFGGRITIMNGGVKSGFKNVKPEEYVPRLLHLKGKKKVRVTEVKCDWKSLNVGDSFLLDNGLELIQWNGPMAGMMEKRKGNQLTAALKDERNGRPKSRILDGSEADDEFWKILGRPKSGDEYPPPAQSELGKATEDKKSYAKVHKIFELSDKSGSLKTTEVTFAKASLKTDEVYLVDIGRKVYTWIGKGASKAERSNGIKFATDYLQAAGRPSYTPIIRIMEKAEPKAFHRLF